MSVIPTVILQGTPFERGGQHGRRFRAEIAGAVAATIVAQGPVAYDAARARARRGWSAIEAQAPAVAAELRGIAEGAGLDPIDVLLRSGFEFFAAQEAIGCSAIAARGADGALVAQNWDAPLSFAPDLALFLHFGPQGFEQAIVGSIGNLGWVGCNRHGLAFVNNDLMLHATRDGLPSQVVRRMILGETSVAAARRLLLALPHMAGRSYLIGDASGDVAGIEVSARHGARVNQTESPVLHTNHALDPAICGDEDAAALQATYPSSRHRHRRLAERRPAAFSVPAIAALLADRDGFPNAVAKAASAEEPSATLFSVIFDCGAGALQLCAGAPSDNAYQQVRW
jgi:isopenicillin-N N-acyltransferase like protein